jgi:hypothetical protein
LQLLRAATQATAAEFTFSGLAEVLGTS